MADTKISAFPSAPHLTDLTMAGVQSGANVKVPGTLFQPVSTNLTTLSGLSGAGITNLSSWSALAPADKQNASSNLTSWSALATSAKQDASENLNSLATVTPGTKGKDVLAAATSAALGAVIEDAVGNSPAFSTATISVANVLTLTSTANSMDASTQAATVVTSVVWSGDADIVRPRNVVLRNSSTTTGFEIILSNNLRAADRGDTGRLYCPPKGAVVFHSFQSGFWFISSHLPSSAMAMEVYARDVLARDYLTDPATPSLGDWNDAFDAAHAAIRSTGGNILFGEPVDFNRSCLIDSFVGVKGISAYTVIHRFGNPEPHMGAVIRGQASLDLGTEDYGWGGGYLQPNGFFNVKLDTGILADTAGRPRVNSVFENFGIIGTTTATAMTRGMGIRNLGTMYHNVRNMSFAQLPSGALRFAGRGDITMPTGPGSANGCRLEDLLITTCGEESGYGIYWGAPDSHCENIQIGNCYGHQIYWAAGNSTGEQIESWNAQAHVGLGLAGENLYLNGAIYSKIDCLLYDSAGANLVIEGTSNDIKISGMLFRPNSAGAGSGTPRDSANAYLASTIEDIHLDLVGDGGAQGHYGLYQLGDAVNLEFKGRMYNHITDDYQFATRNVFGAWAGRKRANLVAATPLTLFSAADPDAVWEVIITRLAANADGARATVFGGTTPTIIAQSTGGTLSLGLSGTNVTATCTATATGLVSWYRVR